MCHRPSEPRFPHLQSRAAPGLPRLTVLDLSPAPGPQAAPGDGRDRQLPHRRLSPGRAARFRPLAPSRWLPGPSCFRPRFFVTTLPAYLVTIRVITALPHNRTTENLSGENEPPATTAPPPHAHGAWARSPHRTVPGAGALPFPPRLPRAFTQRVILLLGHLEGPETGPRAAPHCGS